MSQVAPSSRPASGTSSSAHLRVAPTSRRVANIIVDTLRELGITNYFGIPGGAITPIYDALIDTPGVRLVHNRHETGSLFMAAGSSLMGKIPCVLVTSGPGLTNAITGLASAFADGIPVVVIGGEVASRNFGRGALQEGSKYELDLQAMVRSVTKYSATILNPRSAAAVVRRAVGTALSGRRGPVFLSLPIDVASESVVPSVSSSQVSTTFVLDEHLVERAAKALMTSRKGLILVGSGARHPMAVTQLRILAEMLQIPVATTPKGKGLFPERNPLSLGVFGYGGHLSANKYIQEGPDLIFAVGCGLGETATNSWNPTLQPTGTFIQIDIDGSQIGKNYHVDLGLVGAAHQVLPSIISHLRSRPITAGAASRIVYHAPDDATVDRPALHPARVMSLLQAHFPADTIFTSDIGEHLMFALHYLKVDMPDAFFAGMGLGSMGSGIGMAVGAKYAAPDRPVVSICGDYGFQMFGMELNTCVQYGIGVVFAVLNDGRMRMVEAGFERIFGRHLSVDGPMVDFAALARAHGAEGLVIRSAEDFAQLGPEVFQGVRPVVLDIRIDPEATFAISGRAQQLGNFVGKE
jgi:acetolactate synthase I/II/III large subunit